MRRSCEALQRRGPEAMLELFSDDVIVYGADSDGAAFDGKAGFRDAARLSIGRQFIALRMESIYLLIARYCAGDVAGEIA